MASDLDRFRYELALSAMAELLAERNQAQELCVALADAELEVFCQGTYTISSSTDRWLRGLPGGWREQLAGIRARVTSRALARNRDPNRVETGLVVGVDRARGGDSTAVVKLERQPDGSVQVLDSYFQEPGSKAGLPSKLEPEARAKAASEAAVERIKGPLPELVIRPKPGAVEARRAEIEASRKPVCPRCKGDGSVLTEGWGGRQPCPECIGSDEPQLPPVKATVSPASAEAFRAELAQQVKATSEEATMGARAVVMQHLDAEGVAAANQLLAAGANQPKPKTKPCPNCNGQSDVRNSSEGQPWNPCPTCKATGRVPT